MFTGVKTDISRDVRAKFFEHIMAKREPSATDVNGDEPRRVSALYLGSIGNAQGSILAYDLSTEATF